MKQTIISLIVLAVTLGSSGCHHNFQRFQYRKQAALLESRKTVSAKEAEPTKVTLLLPLTGELAKTGLAVKEGFLAAYYADELKSAKLNIKIVDTNAEDIQRLYQQAVTEGTEVVVGPITKEAVLSLHALKHLPIPIIALNSLDNYQRTYAANLYQFGLLPQDEALQAAMRMLQIGITKCAIIEPASNWGNKIADTFSKHYESKGGQIIARFKYQLGDQLPEQLCTFLAADQEKLCAPAKPATSPKPSIEPETELNPDVNSDTNPDEETDPQTGLRQDFDGFFLIANPVAGRQIIPLLKFYYAGDLPVYAISTIYGGNHEPILDQDLNGVYFCDIPWLIQAPKAWDTSLQTIRAQQPYGQTSGKATNYSRLYALGLDAYKIATKLNEFLFYAAYGTAGVTGKLHLDSYNHIYRELTWAVMRNGKPVAK